MSIKINTGLILATLIFALTLPHAAHAVSRYTLQNNLASHERKGNEYMRQGKYALAENEFDQVIRYMHKLKRKCRGLIKTCYIKDKKAFYKLFAKPYTNRGVCRFGQRNFRGARSDANTAIGWNKDYSRAHWLLGNVAYMQNNMREARKHYEIVARLNPTMAAKMLKFMPKLR